MELMDNIFQGNLMNGNDEIAFPILLLSLVIAFGVVLSKIKVCGISLGVVWILFVGIAFGHFFPGVDGRLLHFLKELGLILFVYSIGLQVGPGFFAAFKKEGLALNTLALVAVLLSVGVAAMFHYVTDIPATALVGVLSGAVTNMAGLGAAQQTYIDINGTIAPETASGYAVAYPLGVAGAIFRSLCLSTCYA